MPKHPPLTPSQKSLVADMILAGRTYPEIAAEIGCTRSCIKNHVRKLRDSGVLPPSPRQFLRPRYDRPATRREIKMRIAAMRARKQSQGPARGVVLMPIQGGNWRVVAGVRYEA